MNFTNNILKVNAIIYLIIIVFFQFVLFNTTIINQNILKEIEKIFETIFYVFMISYNYAMGEFILSKNTDHFKIIFFNRKSFYGVFLLFFLVFIFFMDYAQIKESYFELLLFIIGPIFVFVFFYDIYKYQKIYLKITDQDIDILKEVVHVIAFIFFPAGLYLLQKKFKNDIYNK